MSDEPTLEEWRRRTSGGPRNAVGRQTTFDEILKETFLAEEGQRPFLVGGSTRSIATRSHRELCSYLLESMVRYTKLRVEDLPSQFVEVLHPNPQKIPAWVTVRAVVDLLVSSTRSLGKSTPTTILHRARTLWTRMMEEYFEVPQRYQAPLPLLEDEEGHDLKPDPLTAQTWVDFLERMREFHVWAGESSYRELSHRSGKAFAHTTLCEALKPTNTRRPSLKLVVNFVEACGGSREDVSRWTTAWRQIRMKDEAKKMKVVPSLKAV